MSKSIKDVKYISDQMNKDLFKKIQEVINRHNDASTNIQDNKAHYVLHNITMIIKHNNKDIKLYYENLQKTDQNFIKALSEYNIKQDNGKINDIDILGLMYLEKTDSFYSILCKALRNSLHINDSEPLFYNRQESLDEQEFSKKFIHVLNGNYITPIIKEAIEKKINNTDKVYKQHKTTDCSEEMHYLLKCTTSLNLEESQ